MHVTLASLFCNEESYCFVTGFPQVRLIDVGCVQVVDVNQLLTLPEHFLQIPAQVVEAFICGIKPCDGDPDWPEEVYSIYNYYGVHTMILCSKDVVISVLWAVPIILGYFHNRKDWYHVT